MKKINENKLAESVVKEEGGKQSLSIGQVKEVMRIVLEHLAHELFVSNASGVMELLERHNK